MSEVLRYLLDNSSSLVSKSVLENMSEMSQNAWQDYVDDVKEMVVTYPGMKPCSVRIDQLARNMAGLNYQNVWIDYLEFFFGNIV